MCRNSVLCLHCATAPHNTVHPLGEPRRCLGLCLSLGLVWGDCHVLFFLLSLQHSSKPPFVWVILYCNTLKHFVEDRKCPLSYDLQPVDLKGNFSPTENTVIPQNRSHVDHIFALQPFGINVLIKTYNYSHSLGVSFHNN